MLGLIRSPAFLKNAIDGLASVLVGDAPTTKSVGEYDGSTVIYGANGYSGGYSYGKLRAMQLSAVWACVHVLAETFASCKCHLYRKDAEGHRHKAIENPLYDVLNGMAAPGMPAYYFRETMMTHILTGGNAYAEIVFDREGNVSRLNLLSPEQVTIQQEPDTGKITYRVTSKGKTYVMPADKIFHVPGLGYNGLVGFSPLAMARQAVELGLSAEEYGNTLYGNGVVATGILETEKAINEQGFQKLREDFTKSYCGTDKTGGVMVLPRGVKFSKVSINPAEAQFLESRKYQIEEIARFFRVPLHLVQILDNANYSNIEQQSLDFYQNTMLPWFSRWESFANMKLLTAEQRADGYYVEFDLLSMLRGDSKSRAEMYHIMRQDGVLNGDEWRAKENMNPMPDGLGKHYLVNGNMIPVDVAANKKVGD